MLSNPQECSDLLTLFPSPVLRDSGRSNGSNQTTSGDTRIPFSQTLKANSPNAHSIDQGSLMTEGAGASAPGTQAHQASSRVGRPDAKLNTASCTKAAKKKGAAADSD